MCGFFSQHALYLCCFCPIFHFLITVPSTGGYSHLRSAGITTTIVFFLWFCSSANVILVSLSVVIVSLKK